MSPTQGAVVQLNAFKSVKSILSYLIELCFEEATLSSGKVTDINIVTFLIQGLYPACILQI